MILKIESAKLAEVLGVVVQSCEKKTTIPILSNCKIDSAARIIEGTDLEMCIRVPVEGDAFAPAGGVPEVTVPTRKLLELAKRINGNVTLRSQDNHWVSLSGSGVKAKLVGMAPENWPATPQRNGSKGSVIVPLADFAKLAARVTSAISMESSRYTLQGARLETIGGKLRMVATDGHRLALAEVASEVKLRESLLIPKRALAVAANLDGDQLEIIEHSDDTYIGFIAAGAVADGDRKTELWARKLTGAFPNYSAVLPGKPETTVTIAAEELRAAIERVALMSDSRTHALKFEVAKGTLTLRAQNPESGEIEQTVEVETTGKAQMVGFNAQYMLDFLGKAEGPVVIGIKDETSAIDCTAGEDYRYVVMPMRV